MQARTTHGRRLWLAALALALTALAAPARAQGVHGASTFNEPCARAETFPRPAVNGPFDYRNQRAALGVVEANHYGPQIENLIRGRTGTLAQELSFVLHGFPNHHRALATLSRYSLREKAASPGNLDYSVDCYYQRALVFRPDDHIVRMLFADYLGKTNRPQDAAVQLDYVRDTAGDNPLTHYNLGLLYLQIGRHADALAAAHRAAALGLQRNELRDKLRAADKWSDTPPAGSVASAASAASSPGP